MIQRTALKRSMKPIRKKRSEPRRGPVKDPAYLEWIRTQPCCICERLGVLQEGSTEAAHVGDRGLGQKCSDLEALPLCAWGHHRVGPYSIHVLGKRFWAHHGLDREALIQDYNWKFEEHEAYE